MSQVHGRDEVVDCFQLLFTGLVAFDDVEIIETKLAQIFRERELDVVPCTERRSAIEPVQRTVCSLELLRYDRERYAGGGIRFQANCAR